MRYKHINKYRVHHPIKFVPIPIYFPSTYMAALFIIIYMSARRRNAKYITSLNVELIGCASRRFSFLKYKFK